MRRPVQRRDRNTATSACVGWDHNNIENQLAFRKMAKNQAAKRNALQNGLTTARMTVPIIKIVGTSLITR
jgi:hypothetical protein